MGKMVNMYISDVHMGTDQRWNWYQSRVHKDKLLRMLHYVQECGDFNKVVLLGDFVDLWTTPPELPPPTFSDVVEANKEVFEKLLEIAGNGTEVIYLNGNHDMTVTSEDVDQIPSIIHYKGRGIINHGGEEIREGWHGNILAQHGHQYSVCNRPDKNGFGNTLPLGYFITRLAAGWVQKQVGHDDVKDATDLEGSGNPMPVVKKYVKRETLENALKKRDVSVAYSIIYGMIDGIYPEVDKEKLEFLVRMPETGGNTVSIRAESVVKQYDGCVARFSDEVTPWLPSNKLIKEIAEMFPQLEIMILLQEYGIGGLALLLTDYADNLGPFTMLARVVRMSPVVLMGHTHTWKLETEEGYAYDYMCVNTGFNCSSRIDEKAHTCAVVVEEVKTKYLKDVHYYDTWIRGAIQADDGNIEMRELQHGQIYHAFTEPDPTES